MGMAVTRYQTMNAGHALVLLDVTEDSEENLILIEGELVKKARKS